MLEDRRVVGPEHGGDRDLGAPRLAAAPGDLDAYASEICDCQKCPLGATRNKWFDYIGIAIVDSGFWPVNPLNKAPDGTMRLLAQYDAFTDTLITKKWVDDDDYGHGTHIAAMAAASR